MSDSEDPIDPIDEDDDAGSDLFGDGGDDDAASPPSRRRNEVLNDDDLASDPDEATYDRRRDQEEDEEEAQETRDKVVMAVSTFRHRIPNPKDGILRVLRVPKFVKFEPTQYDSDNFQPTEFDLSNATAEHPQHVVRTRREPKTDRLCSNTNIYRWSDGSVTISIGGEQYEIQKKALAPAADKPYSELQDGHYYCAAAELSSNILMTVGHVTEQYNIRPNKAVGDDALSVLAERMAQASRGSGSGNMFIKTTRDPEIQKREAEAAEKERTRAERRRENAAAKLDGGLNRPPRGGLSIGDLEGRRPGGSRKRGAAGAGKLKKHRPEYDSDDDLPHGVGRHEDYDMEDGFIVASEDEDLEEGEEDDEDLLEDEEEEEEDKPRSKRQRTVEADDRDDGRDDAAQSAEASGRIRRRNIVDDDDEEL